MRTASANTNASKSDKKLPKYVTERTGKKGTGYLVRIREAGAYASATFRTLREAEDFIATTRAKILKGERVSSATVRKTTLNEVFKDYLHHNTVSSQKRGVLNILQEELGRVVLHNFTTAGLSKYITTKLTQEVRGQDDRKKSHPLYAGYQKDGKRRKYSESTIRKYYYAIKNALEWHAKHNDYVFDETPFKNVPPPRNWSAPRTRILEEGELARLIDSCGNLYKHQEEMKCLIMFLSYSACRVGEALKMKWDQLHVDKRKPEKSFVRIPKAHQKTSEKESSFDKVIPLYPGFYEFVKDRLLKLKTSEAELVFGQLWPTSALAGARFKVVTKNANVKDFVLHDLRHSAITNLYKYTTLSDIEIASISGHTEMSTLKRYAQIRADSLGPKMWKQLAKTS